MKLPPLNALKAFEAAARHNGFVGASDELNVTRGAISRHVKLLEDHLGTALFRRHTKGVDLTAAGQRLLPVISDAFARIAREAERVSSAAATDLRIICPPATSIRWLIPKLDDFRQKHPDIRVRLTTDFHGASGFDAAEYDLGFSLDSCFERPKTLEVQTLFQVLLTPACAPKLMPIASPQDLAQHLLLHETQDHSDWTTWIKAFNISNLDPEEGDEFPNLDIAVKAAVMGAGVVMADLVLCREELANGTLIAPFPDMIYPAKYGDACLLGPRDRWGDPKVVAFRTWAADVAAEDALTARAS